MKEKTLREGEHIMEPTHIPTASAVVAAPQHTPGPWVLTSEEGPDHCGVQTFSVCADNSPDGMSVAGDSYQHQCVARVRGGNDTEAKANAERIVRACNSHDDLLAALKLAQMWLANSVPVTHLDGPKPLPVIAAAILKAEGR